MTTMPSMGMSFSCAYFRRCRIPASISNCVNACLLARYLQMGKPSCSIARSRCDFHGYSSVRPSSTLNAIKVTRRSLQAPQSSRRTEPAARLRPFLYGSPFPSRSVSFNAAKSLGRINASPVTTNRSLYEILSGIPEIPITLWVMSSPVSPSPRVAASIRRPFS